MNVTIEIMTRGNLVTRSTSSKGSNIFQQEDIGTGNPKRVGSEKVVLKDNNNHIDDNLPNDY